MSAIGSEGVGVQFIAEGAAFYPRSIQGHVMIQVLYSNEQQTKCGVDRLVLLGGLEQRTPYKIVEVL